MKKILEIFQTITSIPHCSFKTEKLKEYLIDECKRLGADVKVDSVGNILATKGDPKLCLQSHYDMVCVGKAPDIQITEDEGYLRANNSSLGADNGIGVAMMLYLLEKKDNLELLFTNDEEVGLIGANGLELSISAKYLLNLDSEEEGAICLGCAGGVDVFASKKFFYKEIDSREFNTYELKTVGFIGGHSGVDIDKNIKNAISELAFFMKKGDCKIVDINGGEAGNAIPKSVKATVITDKRLENSEYVKVKKVEKKCEILDVSDELLDFLVSFPSGVRSYDKSLNLVQTSINLATIKCEDNTIMIEISPRAMSEDDMQRLLLQTRVYLESFGFSVEEKNPYPSWKPFIGEFAQKVQSVSKKYFDNSNFYAIHAGLECGVILSKNPHLEAVSIGPNIYYPHSTREKVEIKSIEKTLKLLEELV